MGAWGNGIFQNDAALDWVCELEQVSDLSLIEQTFAFLLADDYAIEFWDAMDGLAAVETVAAINGNMSEQLPQEVFDWVHRYQFVPDLDLTERARRVALKIRNESEGRYLWEENGEVNVWFDLVDEVLARLLILIPE